MKSESHNDSERVKEINQELNAIVPLIKELETAIEDYDGFDPKAPQELVEGENTIMRRLLRLAQRLTEKDYQTDERLKWDYLTRRVLNGQEMGE